MTREEAIKVLSSYDVNGVWADVDGKPYNAEEQAEAFDMATEALQTPPISQRIMYQEGYRQGREEALKQVTGKLNNHDDSLLTADSEICKEQKSKLDLISRAEAIEAIEIVDWYHQNSNKDMIHGANDDEHQAWYKAQDIYKALEAVPSADRPRDEEDQLKFYYVESIDDYWIGMRIDNFYYADWHEGLGFVWSKSRHLPWGEHIVDENTLWKEHAYPSEPIEIPFTDWIVGFVKKYFADRPRGEWIETAQDYYEMVNKKGGGVNENTEYFTDDIACPNCLAKFSNIDNETERFNFCPNCGADVRGGERREE